MTGIDSIVVVFVLLSECIAPTPPANGNVTVSADGNIATYACDVGFVLKGNATRVCQASNAWNGEEPICGN